jgi:isopentenyldiphosphate isomerase
MRPQEPDPRDEWFDVVDCSGNPTGEVKRRSDVHRDGDWHRAFHCWVVMRSHDAQPAIVFQRRSHAKDTYPGRLDVAVGGHYRAGEGFDEVVREIDEELGISPPVDSLVSIGRRWAEGITESWIDREIEDVYVYALSAPVATLLPSAEEITALDVITVRAIDSLFHDDEPVVMSRRFLVGPDNVLGDESIAEVTREDFVPVRDNYWLRGAQAAQAVLDGETEVSLQLDGGRK